MTRKKSSKQIGSDFDYFDPALGRLAAVTSVAIDRERGAPSKKGPADNSHAGPFTYIDLFCGCGGLSLGLKRSGLSCAAAIDSDPNAISTFKANFPAVEHVLERDLTNFTPELLRKIIGAQKIDVIVGGPPCQGFSRVRMVDGSNHGKRLVVDPRRLLYKNYLHYVEYFKPSIFVMENVPGIRSAAGGEFFISIQTEARKLGYRVHAAPIRAWHYGVPQKRERQLIIGTSCNLPIFSTNLFVPQTHEDPIGRVSGRKPKLQRGGRGRRRELEKPVTLWEAIGDLPPVRAGRGEFETDYDVVRGRQHIQTYGDRYLKGVLEVHRSTALTGHVARPHSERDLRDFDRLREGDTSGAAIARGEQMEFPYDREHFKDRYTRQHRDALCSTIMAHLSKDGLMYIHPTQRRSLTVREAARVQSFPDWFELPRSRTVAFRLIGNAVPPLLGQAVGRGIKRYLGPTVAARELSPLPASPRQAVEWLTPAVHVAQAASKLRTLTIDEFKKAWFSVGFLDNWLHPDSAGDNGDLIVDQGHQSALLAAIAPQIAAPAYAQSGWPIRLVPLAKEAARRFQVGHLRFDEYYYSGAQIAGWEWCRSNRGAAWGRKNTS
jgi:DNA (cytosine-5)-methyltransferase 1